MYVSNIRGMQNGSDRSDPAQRGMMEKSSDIPMCT